MVEKVEGDSAHAEVKASMASSYTLGAAKCMFVVIGVLGVCHAINYYLKTQEIKIFGGDYFYRFFDLNMEQNIPAWYASVLWFMVFQFSLLNYWLERWTKAAKPHSWVWLFFAILFLGASADEVATIHEHVGSLLQDLVVPTLRGQIATYFVRNGFSAESFVVHFSTSKSPWVLFYAPFLLGAGGFCWLFLWRRFAYNRHLRALMLAAALCYLVAESFDYIQGLRSPPVSLIPQPLGLSWPQFMDLTVMIEELLEDSGTVLIILALGRHFLHELKNALPGGILNEKAPL
ncbi:MAG TPA: hypothetical protein PKZ32_09500 [Candidatus Melainabacteria bacterium]|nr:hypothetical protein [Candidatus Melainabacteria bacterium]